VFYFVMIFAKKAKITPKLIIYRISTPDFIRCY